MLNKRNFTALLASALLGFSPASQAADAALPTEQASAIVKPMRFMDEEQTQRAIELTANYLRELATLDAQRSAALAASGEPSDAAPEIHQQTADAWKTHRRFAIALRDAYVAQLNSLMAPGRVDRVKDGLTGDWYHLELQRFDRLAPDLSYPERAHIVGLLEEMRENAMLEIQPKLQLQWAHKYRGIINNYIAAQGHDFHALAKAYKETYEN
ncbi:DUF3826 domain-containing protein [Pelagicoccus sp. SDUM812005]|uniref:DUF3826 domain-containing protein n=1 Tax=Pelagicoccus sp. SDUM812005 TaxID=3041257 RepID=UPI00280C7895|nr:DUF3826 domain-containing protein [Pelagicoccus sp. SDUM812005]MDQ8179162.1 DUF3826 domain-containing protein [Pelagicoccus sp. SDUM812005]